MEKQVAQISTDVESYTRTNKSPPPRKRNGLANECNSDINTTGDETLAREEVKREKVLKLWTKHNITLKKKKDHEIKEKPKWSKNRGRGKPGGKNDRDDEDGDDKDGDDEDGDDEDGDDEDGDDEDGDDEERDDEDRDDDERDDEERDDEERDDEDQDDEEGREDEGRDVEGEPPNAYPSSWRISHTFTVTIPIPTPSRHLCRSRSARPRYILINKEVSKQRGKRQYSQRVVHKIPQLTPNAFTMIVASIKAMWMVCRHKAASHWSKMRTIAGIVYDSVSLVVGFFVNYLLRYMVMLLTLALLVSIAHRAICEIPLVRHFHSQCTSVWAPKPVYKDPQQDVLLQRLEEPLQSSTELLNQLQLNQYFDDLPLALFNSAVWMTRMRIDVEYTSLEIPSKKHIAGKLREYAAVADETGENVSKLWASIPLIVSSVLYEREDLLSHLKESHSRAEENSTLTSVLDTPGLLWSFMSTWLLDRPVLTPYQTRQVEEENARIHLLKRFFPVLDDLLGRITESIDVTRRNFDQLHSIVQDVSTTLQINISQVNKSLELIARAQPEPFHRLRSLFRRNEKERTDLGVREAQLELLIITASALTDTVRELIVMTHVVRMLQKDMESMKETLWVYERHVKQGRTSEKGLLLALKVGMEELALGRASYKERAKQRNIEWHERHSRGIAESLMEFGNVAGDYNAKAKLPK